jgi:hypothetical protein
VRDIMRTVGSSNHRGTLVHRVDALEASMKSVETRDARIDLAMKQYVRDMKNIGSGGGQRAGDRALQDLIENASPDSGL